MSTYYGIGIKERRKADAPEGKVFNFDLYEVSRSYIDETPFEDVFGSYIRYGEQVIVDKKDLVLFISKMQLEIEKLKGKITIHILTRSASETFEYDLNYLFNQLSVSETILAALRVALDLTFHDKFEAFIFCG